MTADGFLEGWHAPVSLAPAALCGLVERATGRAPAAVRRVVAGLECEVYRVAIEDGRAVFVRIRRFGGACFASQAWAMEACRAEGVPVPALLALETIDEDGEELETMVVEEAPGHPLKEVLPALTESEQRIVLSRFGETLRRIHQVPAGGFYQRDAAGRWDFPDWSSIMASALENRAAERELLARAGLGSADVDALLAAAERYGREFPCERPVLCHGDFSTRHVFVDDELRISAVLDFGQLQGGARELDLGRLLFDRFPPALEAVVAGYGAEALAPDGDERLRLGALLFGLGVVAHLVSIGLLKDIDENVARLRALL